MAVQTSASNSRDGLGDAEHGAYRESVRAFLTREVAPHYDQWRREGAPPREVFTRASDHGFATMAAPQSRGGSGVDDPWINAIVAEEAMLWGFAGFGLILTMHNDVGVRALGEQAKAQELVAFATGCVDRPLERVVGGLIADRLVVADGDKLFTCRTDDGVSRHASGGIIGMRGAAFADLTLNAAKLTELEHPQWRADQHVSLAVLSIACARSAMRVSLAYVRQRRAFGVPIASFENTRHMLARVAAEIQATRALVETCLAAQAAGTLEITDAAAAKLVTSELAGRAVDAGVQLHGGYGYMLEYPIAHAYADARFLRLYGGTSEQMLDEVAATDFSIL